jgi:hypothetical protein
MTHLPFLALLALAVTVVASILTYAAEPTFWQISTEAELLDGEAESVEISAQGRLTLGPAAETLYSAPAPFLWDLVTTADGSVSVGSGNDGRVYRVDADGEATVLFDADELEVHALARGPDGTLYAGTSPSGRIYRLRDDATAELFFDPDGDYIWALAVDAAGVVFAATGEPGDVYRIEPDGTGSVFYRTQATHAMTLALGDGGEVFVGTASPGRIFRLDAAGRPFVLLDSAYDEIRRLRRASDGTIYAAALGMDTSGGGRARPARTNGVASTAVTAGASTTVTVTTSTSAVVPTSPPAAGDTRGTAGAVYQVLPTGEWDRIWQSSRDAPYDLLLEADGTLLVATGNDGKLFRLDGDPVESALVMESMSEQITALAHTPDGALLVATANPGRILRLTPSRATSGTYLSSVRDAGEVATWGSISWQGTAGTGLLELATRSGNTSSPDETWSAWSQPYGDPTGAPIVSPRTRFLQWRASLTNGPDAAPVLDSVTVAYLPRNTRPRIVSITLHPPGTVFQETFPLVPGIAGFSGERQEPAVNSDNRGAALLGRPEYQPGLLTFVWQGTDDDQDELRYTVQYRRERDTAWMVLRENLRNSILVWDTMSVPNGRYILRVVVSDSPSNAPDTRLTGLLDSETFAIDNTAPAIEVTSVRRDGTTLLLTFVVRDGESAISSVDYSLDGNSWQAAYPQDGIADSRVERFELAVTIEEPAQSVVLRAVDSLNNAATTSTALPPE